MNSPIVDCRIVKDIIKKDSYSLDTFPGMGQGNAEHNHCKLQLILCSSKECKEKGLI